MSKILQIYVQKITATKTWLILLIKVLIRSNFMCRDSWLPMLAFYRPKNLKNWVIEVETRLILRGMLELKIWHEILDFSKFLTIN